LVGIWSFFSPVRFHVTGSDGPLAASKAAPAEKSGLPVGPEDGELSKEELIRRKREEFIQKHGRGLDKSR
jgi:signal recognition particle receptor subunit alpha